MPHIFEYKCSLCEFTMPTGWGGYMYVIDNNGRRIVCPHPGEASVVAEILKIDEDTLFGFPWLLRSDDAPVQLLEERTGFNSYCVCLDCVSQFELDIDRDERKCPKCGSEKVRTEPEMVGEPCPKCKKGTVELIDTHRMS